MWLRLELTPEGQALNLGLNISFPQMLASSWLQRNSFALFSFVIVLFCLQVFMLFIYLILYNFPINIRLDKGKDNGTQNNNLGNERGQVTRKNWLMN